MSAKFQEFSVSGLYGTENITVSFIDNSLVLVGVNGLGKSTVLNLFYFFITRKWKKTLEYDFVEISLKVKGRRLTLSRIEIEEGFEQNRFHRMHNYHLPPPIMKRLTHDNFINSKELLLSGKKLSKAELSKIASELDVPLNVMSRIQKHIQQVELPLEDENNFEKVNNFLRKEITDRILYLPTYRRIEKEIKDIFPNMNDERFNLSPFRRMRDRGLKHIEFVEFGMEDVSEKLDVTLAKINTTVRQNLNSLTSTNLRDVIRGNANTYDVKLITSLSEEKVEKILQRVKEDTLNEDDKRHLKEVISNIKHKKKVEGTDEYIAHYFSNLVELVLNVEKEEKHITNFVDVCNKYLYGKKFIYNEFDYSLKVYKNEGGVVELPKLSSGEKQIVSLFSHLYLDRDCSNLVLIDEPELSLSVDWQMTFLPDIKASGTCGLIVAVTHSPFIFENEFDESAVDLLLCKSKYEC